MKPLRLLNALGAAAIVVTGLSCSQNTGRLGGSRHVELNATVVTNIPPAQAGAFLIPKLTGETATNQAQQLERFRHLPKQAALAARVFTEPRAPRESLRYLLFQPATTNTQPLPLVLSLHGGGPRHRFEDLLEPYTPGFAYGLGRLVAPESQREHPCFVIAPWSDNSNWDERNLRLVLGLLDALQVEFKIDPTRLYVTGQSMGGFGTWTIITAVPARFAAAIPICGGGEPGDAPRVRQLPIWAFHGSGDTVVPVDYTRAMIHALRQAGGNPIYWEYKDATHADTAERAYCEPELLDWLFAQKRN
jgi:predicted peptidase